MPLAPEFWSKRGAAAWSLWPLSLGYGRIAGWRMARPGRAAPIPVLCVGNLTVGGGGKTPTAIALARLLAARGHHPGFLTRGYGGVERGPLVVDPERHRAADVGDEPLLLAAAAPTVVAHDRPAGAQRLAELGADIAVMDDGFQNPSLAKDLSVVVLDARFGIGNGFVLPAGPLRAPLGDQLRRTDLLLVVGEGEHAVETIRRAARRGTPVARAELAPEGGEALKGCPVLAFCGIAHPGKFEATLEEVGADVRQVLHFPDHHTYSEEDCRQVLERAAGGGLTPVTTEKDLVRLRGRGGAAGSLAAQSLVLPVRMRLQETRKVLSLIDAALGRRLASLGGNSSPRR